MDPSSSSSPPGRPSSSLRGSRRTLMTGAAWAAPVAVAALSAPAYAISVPPPPAVLRGEVVARGSCGPAAAARYSTFQMEVDGRGTYPEGGLWVESGRADRPPSSLTITAYYPTVFYEFEWTPADGNDGWSPLRPGGEPESARKAFLSTYTGTWTYRAESGVWVADGALHATAQMGALSCIPYWVEILCAARVGDATSSFRRRYAFSAPPPPEGTTRVADPSGEAGSPAASDGGG